MPPRPAPRLSRRELLLGSGAAAAAVLLGACSDGSDVDTTGSSSTGDGSGAGDGSLALAQFFGGPMFVAGQPARMPFGVADADGLLPLDRTPERLLVEVLDGEGTAVADPVEVERRAEGLHQAYFPLLVTVADPGVYTVRAEVGGSGAERTVQVDAADDVKVIQPGEAMPSVETPTTSDARGVEPICTRQPVCPLHDVSLASALTAGSPLALLVATPAFCQIAICGPVLDILLDVRADHPDVRFLHAEVYADPATDLTTYAPVIEPLGLHFEPCLVLVGADGTIVDRIDTIYDRSEVTERLAALG